MNYTIKAKGKDFKRVMENVEWLENEATYKFNVASGSFIDMLLLRVTLLFGIKTKMGSFER